MKTGVIKEFSGEYFFLSNFYKAEFSWRNQVFPTAEHAFQYAKTWHMDDVYITDMQKYSKSIFDAPTPKEAKRLGRQVKLDVKEWDNHKVWLMREIIHAKFSQVPDLAGQLINTGAMLLVEGNDWGDEFWGRCNGRGFNTLGAILMEERGYWLRGRHEEI